MLSLSLSHRFADGGFALDVAFDAPGAGVTALFGPSGCGKTTILSAVAGLMRPASGRIGRGGEVLFDAAAGIFVPPERRRCGVVFQEARLFPHLSVAANLRYGLSRAPAGAATRASTRSVLAGCVQRDFANRSSRIRFSTPPPGCCHWGAPSGIRAGSTIGLVKNEPTLQVS